MARLPRNLHFKIHIAQLCQGALPQECFQAQRQDINMQLSRETSVDFGKRPTCPKVTIHCTCHEIQSAAPATESAFQSNAGPIPCACHEKSALDHQNMRFPLRLPRKVTTMSENAHGTTAESAVPASTRRGQPYFASLRSRNALRGLREAWMYCKQL